MKPQLLLSTIITAGFLPGAGAPPLLDVTPVSTFVLQVKQQVQLEKPIIREAIRLPVGLAFLVQSRNIFAIIFTGSSGEAKGTIGFDPATRVDGLAPTDLGFATVVSAGGTRFIREFNSAGAKLHELPVACYAGPGLLVIGSRPATTCPDGTITKYRPDGSAVSMPSWMRPGALTEVIGDSSLMIIDQGTAQILINNLRTNQISAVTTAAAVPEFEESRRRLAAAQTTAATSLSAGSPPLGKSIIAMATASDATSWYVLVYPYDGKVGPVVVRFDGNANVISRYRCRLPATGISSIHKILIDRGDLLLVSVNGDVFRYKV